ncbi:hypothetical protein E2562_035871 [Oryza meyeriana var. granulata]|uniref:Uncharacterized protein n=1 Tax=Oryza meyeriana var. granulata TaxID=110450 RepID=A0A6G1CWX1_9ORYZ|nr:hypothetical protein E2562_035871 [Oryza meyeriana var. granulata]
MSNGAEKTTPVGAGQEGTSWSSSWRVACRSMSGIRQPRAKQARKKVDLPATLIEIRVADSHGIESVGSVQPKSSFWA